jgi:hypothetical protein
MAGSFSKRHSTTTNTAEANKIKTKDRELSIKQKKVAEK